MGLPEVQATEAPEKDFFVFHAGTALGGENGKEIVTAGGRVIMRDCAGDSVKVAQRRAYEIAEQIHFDGCQLRHDIGYRAINHPRK